MNGLTVLCASLLLMSAMCLADVRPVFQNVPAPLLAWSNTDAFPGRNVDVTKSTSSVDLSTAIAALLDQQPAKLDAILLFSVSSMSAQTFRSKAGELRNFRRLIAEAESSFQTSYFFQDNAALLSRALAARHLLVLDVADAGAVSTLQARIATRASGETPLLVQLQMPALDAAWPSTLDGTVGTFVAALGSHKYAAFFLSRAGPRSDVNLEEDVRARLGRQQTTAPPAGPSPYGNCSDNSTACYGSYFPGVMLESLFVVLLIIVIASVGVSCTFGLQSPDRFEPASKRPAAN
jgi:hypothetical protein